MNWTKEWRKAEFSDEKRFNLDGPDGFQYYFHDLRKETKILSKRQQGGGSIMIWAAIGYNKKTELKFLSERVNAVQYKNMLATMLPSLGVRMAGRNWIFQQDNSRVHTANVMKKWFA